MPLSHPRRVVITFVDLPVEIHEAILNHIFGKRAPTGPGRHPKLGWDKTLHHPRSKALSAVSLICRLWRTLVQSRIYRHIKIEATREELEACARWFRYHPHLNPHVCHIQVWIPTLGARASRSQYLIETDQFRLSEVAALAETFPDLRGRFFRTTKLATLHEIFQIIQRCFPEARIFTLEGGHTKFSVAVEHYRHTEEPQGRSLQGRDLRSVDTPLPVLSKIETFVMRGAWNLMRSIGRWQNILNALPAVREWQSHCGQPHPSVYYTMMYALPRFPTKLRYLSLSLEGFTKEDDIFIRRVYRMTGDCPLFCQIVAKAAPRLLSFAYTGRVCWYFFQSMRNEAIKTGHECRLTSLDIILKGFCPNPALRADDPLKYNDFSGVGRPGFIKGFEQMIMGVIECLSAIPTLTYVRIRYLDLTSIVPTLSPYFQLVNDKCTGLWSSGILGALRTHRPSARFVEIDDGVVFDFDNSRDIVAVTLPGIRPDSVRVDTYEHIAAGSVPW